MARDRFKACLFAVHDSGSQFKHMFVKMYVRNYVLCHVFEQALGCMHACTSSVLRTWHACSYTIICWCMCACPYVCVHACYVWTCLGASVGMHALFVCVYVFVCVCTCLCMHRVYVHMCVYAFVCVCMHVFVYAFVCVFLYVRVCVCICVRRVCVCVSVCVFLTCGAHTRLRRKRVWGSLCL